MKLEYAASERKAAERVMEFARYHDLPLLGQESVHPVEPVAETAPVVEPVAETVS